MLYKLTRTLGYFVNLRHIEHVIFYYVIVIQGTINRRNYRHEKDICNKKNFGNFRSAIIHITAYL